jgi:hypothetical protein
MNAVERLLYQEVTHFMDRLATSVPPGAALAPGAGTARARLDEAEAELASAQAAMLDGYGRWRRALDDVENLWALAAWRSTAAEEPRQHAPALAA